MVNQINLLTGRYGKNIMPVQESNEMYTNLLDTLADVFNTLIAISERLHDYKDREIEMSLNEISDRDNKPIDLSKE